MAYKEGGVRLVQMTKIIKIAKKLEANDIKKKSSDRLQQSNFSQNMFQGKECKKFGLSNQFKGQADETTPIRVAITKENHPIWNHR